MTSIKHMGQKDYYSVIGSSSNNNNNNNNTEALEIFTTVISKISDLTTEYLSDVFKGDTNSSEPVNLSNFSEYLVNTSDLDMYSNKTDVDLTDFKYNATLKLYDFFVPVIGALAIVLNLAVVVSSGLILKKGQQPRSTYLLLGNVAMTDLITAISVVFGQMYPTKYRDHYICAIQLGMIVSSTVASVFSVGMIAVDRFLYILHGLQYQRWVYPTRVRTAIAISWFIGCFVGFLPLFGWYGDTQSGKKCWFILLAPKELIIFTVAVGGIPLLTVLILYTIILYHAIKNIMRLQRATEAHASNAISNENGLRIFRGRSNTSDTSENEDTTNNEKPTEPNQAKQQNMFKKIFMRKPTSNVKGPSKWKAIKVVLFTSGSFLITWGPYFIASLLYAFDDKDSPRCRNLSALIASPFAILGFFNSLINPIIYAWWHKGFRSFIKRQLSSVRRKRSTSVSPISKNTTSSTPIRKNSNTSNSSNTKEVVKLEPVVVVEKTDEVPPQNN